VSVRPEFLGTSEGTLVSISIAVQPRALESLLETLAGVSFPINPQIYHGASTTLVEFPAYAGRVEEVRQAIAAGGFDQSAMQVTGMLEELQSETRTRRRVMVVGKPVEEVAS
jgi:hypothetical protein